METLTPDLVPLLRNVQEKLLERHTPLLQRAAKSPADREVLRFVLGRLLVEDGHVADEAMRQRLVPAILSEVIGFGPLDSLLADETITEIMVNGPAEIFVERRGSLNREQIRFRDTDHLLDTIRRMAGPLGRRLDYALPFVDGSLPSGARFHAIIPPLTANGPVLTIRKFRPGTHSLADLAKKQMLPAALGEQVLEAVRRRLTVIISGGTGSGKTTLLTALARDATTAEERLIVVEDAREIALSDRHAINLIARPPGVEGSGTVTIRDLVRNALRMRPDRLFVGEVRGPESFDLLQALNTGHSGSLSTIHANSPTDALLRLETMALMAGEQVPHHVIRQLVASCVDLVVHVAKVGTHRRVVSVAAVTSTNKYDWQLHELCTSGRAWQLPSIVSSRWQGRATEWQYELA